MTSRQRQVLRLMSLGLTNQQIATELGIGVETVKDHAARIRHHLDAKSKTHAVAVAFQTGLLR